MSTSCDMLSSVAGYNEEMKKEKARAYARVLDRFKTTFVSSFHRNKKFRDKLQDVFRMVTRPISISERDVIQKIITMTDKHADERIALADTVLHLLGEAASRSEYLVDAIFKDIIIPAISRIPEPLLSRLPKTLTSIQKDIDKYIRKNGTEGLKKRFLNNPNSVMYEIQQHIGDDRWLSKNFKEYSKKKLEYFIRNFEPFPTVVEGIGRTVGLHGLPVGTLRVMVNEIHSWLNPNENFFSDSRFKRRIAKSLWFPKTLARKDPTGVLYKVYEASMKYMQNIGRKKRVYDDEWERILGTVKGFSSALRLSGDVNIAARERVMVELFLRMLRGQYKPFLRVIEMGKTGQKTLEKQFTSVMDMAQFIADAAKNEKYRILYMGFYEYEWSGTGFNKLVSKEPAKYYKHMLPEGKATKEGEYTDEEIILEGNRRQFTVFAETLKAAHRLFDNFFIDTTQTAAELSKRLEKKLQNKKPELAHLYDELFSMMSVMGSFEVESLAALGGQGAKVGYRQWYVPTEYDEYLLRLMVTELIINTREEMSRTTDDAELEELEKKLKALEELRESIRVYSGSFVTEDRIIAAVGVKNFEPVTGLFDPTIGRHDEKLFSRYITRTLTTLERNRFVLDVIDALEKTDNQDLQRYIVDYLVKATLRRPDTPADLFGFKVTTQAYSNALSKALKKTIPLSPQRIDQYVRAFNQFLTSNLLVNLDTAIGNTAGNLQKITAYGLKWFLKAVDELNKHADEWEERFKEASISEQVEQIADYFALKISEGESNILREGVKQRVKELLDKPDITDVEFEKELKTILREMRLDIPIDKVRAFTNWAMNEKFFKAVPGIATTEKSIRKLSFVLGCMIGAEATGLSYNDPRLWEIGIRTVYEQDFMLQQQGFPAAFKGTIGNMLIRLRSYDISKMSYEVQMVKRAFLSADRYVRSRIKDKNKRDLGAYIITLPTFLRCLFSTETRYVSPEVAELKNFLLTYGLMTFLVDYVLFSPAFAYYTVTNMRGLPYAHFFTRATSPTVSLALFLAFRLPMVAFGARDRELDEDELITFLRLLPIGVVPSLMLNMATEIGALLIGERSAEEDRWLKRQLLNNIVPFVPGGRLTTIPVRTLSLLQRSLSRPEPNWLDLGLD